MELSIYNIQGQATGKKVNLSDEVFAIEPNEHAVYLDVKQFLANQRQGTHKNKGKAGSKLFNKKNVETKGTGGARHGSRKANIYVGGARVFGPRPRDYSFKLNKKLKELARKSVLSAKAKESQITILEDFTFESPKTKSYVELLSAFSLVGKKTILILPENNKNVVLSGRNLPKTKITTASNINTYDLINSDVILLAESAVQKLNEL